MLKNYNSEFQFIDALKKDSNIYQVVKLLLKSGTTSNIMLFKDFPELLQIFLDESLFYYLNEQNYNNDHQKVMNEITQNISNNSKLIFMFIDKFNQDQQFFEPYNTTNELLMNILYKLKDVDQFSEYIDYKLLDYATKFKNLDIINKIKIIINKRLTILNKQYLITDINNIINEYI